MFEATERPATEPAPRLDVLMVQAITEVRKGREIVQHDIRRRGDLLELVMWASRLGETEKAIREAAIFAAVTEQLGDGPEQLGAVPEPAPARNRRHARRLPRQRGQQDSQDPPLMRPVLAWLPAPIAACWAALKHAWAAHHMATVAVPVTVVTVAATATLAPSSLTRLPYVIQMGPHASSSATPARLPSSILIASTVFHPRHARSAPSQLPTGPVPPAPLYAPPPSPSPSQSTPPSPSPSQSTPPFPSPSYSWRSRDGRQDNGTATDPGYGGYASSYMNPHHGRQPRGQETPAPDPATPPPPPPTPPPPTPTATSA